MDQTYSSSYLTISADNCLDSKAGFLDVRNMLGWTTCIHPTLVIPWCGRAPGSHYGTFSGQTLERSKLTGRPVPTGPRAVCCGVAPAKTVMNTSVLSDRGWILQERLLSRRILHWSVYEVSWECNEIMASERMPAGHREVGEDWGWAARDLVTAPWIKFRKILYRDLNELRGPDRWPVRDAGGWHDLVQEFTRRTLTVPSDRLPSISGLSNAYRKAVFRPATSYIFGMWRETLLYDLCWFRVGSAASKETTVCSLSFPSFSWASINSPIAFLRPFTVDLAHEHVEILCVEGPQSSSASITLHGLVFNVNILVEQHPVHPFGDSGEGNRDAMIWDVTSSSGPAKRRKNTICLCFAIVKSID
jgi:hypothetical protein